jgi:1-acyl-sn-glycerol-3-phosphate acyltransferase
MGWRYEGNLPAQLKKFVLVAAPHTSNFDFPLAKAAFYLMGIKVKFMAKKSLFRWPFGKIFLSWGGLPVERSAQGNLVETLRQYFDQNDELALVIAPEGTRKAVERWRSGFYHIAFSAGVPIVCGYLDYGRKVAGFGPIITDLGNYQDVLAQMRHFYATIKPKDPNGFNPNFS